MTEASRPAPLAGYAMPLYDPRFRQSLPHDREWLLVEDRKGQLLYRDDEGTELLVPAMWYNQTTEMCVSRWRFYAERNRDCAANLLARPKNLWDVAEAAKNVVKAAELDALADHIAATGKPGYRYLDKCI